MSNGVLADLFRGDDGRRVAGSADWRARRAELLELIVDVAYGGMPPAPAVARAELLHEHPFAMGGMEDARFRTYRLSAGPGRVISFGLTLALPPGGGPFPVVLCGDACWRYANDAVAEECLRRGYILALFNRTELAPDIYSSDRGTGLYPLYPDLAFGALAAWAWGYHRCVDFLATQPVVRDGQIAITGHSRGGKTALLAGATDERIAVTCANNSGNGGAGSYHIKGPACEALSDGMGMFPYWYGPRMAGYADREADLPFDQHGLKAAIAPRAFLSTEALGDLWANPLGTWQTHCAAREVWRFLGAEGRVGIDFREGGHTHILRDWRLFLDFADVQLGRATHDLALCPYPGAAPAFAWRAPIRGGTTIPWRSFQK